PSSEPPTHPEPITTKESGESSQCFCEICSEKKEADEMFRIDACSHSYCSICIAKHVTIKIRESAPEPVVACPGFACGGVLELSTCRSRMPGEVAAMWEDLLCEAAITAEEKFYCPFRDCSAMLVNDDDGGEGITECECPVCHRLFCARCYVPWHVGVGCEEFGGG
ncbi:E3 ubiquitin-protein like, partial [Actinidia chinensis var. chinensis]